MGPPWWGEPDRIGRPTEADTWVRSYATIADGATVLVETAALFMPDGVPTAHGPLRMTVDQVC